MKKIIIFLFTGLLVSLQSFAGGDPMLKHDPLKYYSGESLRAALAIRKGEDKDLAALLKQFPTLVASRGNQNLPLLAWAMGHNNLEAFKHLLAAGASPNDFFMVEDAKMSLLSFAVGAEKSHWFDLLLKYTADPNGLPETRSPLITAFYANKFDRLERLLEAGAKINLANKVGTTLIIEVVLANDYLMALRLVKRGADINVQAGKGKLTIRKIIERYPLPSSTPQGQAQAELAKMLK
jgi:ankyrin repeat protein